MPKPAAADALESVRMRLTPGAGHGEWRRALKAAIQHGDVPLTIEALKYMIGAGLDVPGHWSRLVGLLNGIGAEDEVARVLVLWREKRPEQLAQQLPHARRAFAAGSVAMLKPLWPVYAGELPAESLTAACLGLLRRGGAEALIALLAEAKTAPLGSIMKQAAALCCGRPVALRGLKTGTPSELEIVAAIAARFIAIGNHAGALAALQLLARVMDARAPVPGLNELLDAALKSADRELVQAALPLARKNHHVLLREVLATALAGGHAQTAGQALDRLHLLFQGNSSIFQLSLGIADPALRRATIDRLLRDERRWAKDDPALAASYGRNLMLCGRLGESRVALLNALMRWPDDTRLHVELAETCFWLDDYETAEKHARRVIDAETCRAAAAGLLTRIAIARGDGREAIAAFRIAEAAGPLTFPGLQHHAMMCGGEFVEAFSQYWSTGGGAQIATAFPTNRLQHDQLTDCIESGRKLGGTTVVLGVHGLGDAIRFSQALPRISQLCENAVFLCDERLLGLYRRSFPELGFEGWSRGFESIEISKSLAAHIDARTLEIARRADHVSDLKFFLRFLYREPRDFSSARGHLRVDRDMHAAWETKFRSDPGIRHIGLFWRSSIVGYHAFHKRSELNEWVQLMKGAPIRIVPLQYGLSDSERELIGSHSELFLPPDFDTKDDIEQLAALMSALDLVIALPGTTQHLAGAVGAPTIMPAHPYDAGWRRNPATRYDWWSPSVRIITGKNADGLRGSMIEAAQIASDWPILE